MIEVRMAEYCEQCPWFEVGVKGDLLYGNHEVVADRRKIVCLNEKRCAYVAGKVASMKDRKGAQLLNLKDVVFYVGKNGIEELTIISAMIAHCGEKEIVVYAGECEIKGSRHLFTEDQIGVTAFYTFDGARDKLLEGGIKQP